MADSVGGAFPRGINVGHIHMNNVDGFVYRYLGDVPTNPLNWVIIGGAADNDPSTVGWTTRQDGATWFNKTLNTFRAWDGTQVVTVGGSSGGSGVQRWPLHITGTEISIGFGGTTQVYFVAPAAGTITKWAIIVGTVPLPQDTTFEFYYDPFGALSLVDLVTLVATTVSVKNERVISQVVNAGDIVEFFISTTYNPANHSVIIDGFVDFTPS